jgi:taurine-pyruvate aminotransferase
MENSTQLNDIREVVENDRMHVWHHLNHHKKFETIDPPIMVEGKGIEIWDANGKRFLDAVSGGVWTVNVGYGRTEIADAVRDQLIKMNYFAGTIGNVPAANFAKKLIEKMPGMSRVYFNNSGSEANEKVYKMVRQISHRKYGGKKFKILYRDRDYHGTTIANLSAGGHEQRNAEFGPYTPGFVKIPHCLEYRNQYDSAEDYGKRSVEAIEEIILREGADTIGAMVLEPITAGGGVITPPEGYWEGVQALCKKYDILLHIDEVVCGLGRTGKWFGYQHYDIKPDFVTMAKGVASGYAAIACTVTTEEIFEFFKEDESDPLSYFRDISTFGGCTAGPVAALENIRIIEDEGLVENCAAMGEYLFELLLGLQKKHEVIGDVRGKGLFAGIELVKDRETKEPVEEKDVQATIGHCLNESGVMIGATNRSLPGFNNSLLFSPALIATKANIEELVDAVDAALSEVFG